MELFDASSFGFFLGGALLSTLGFHGAIAAMAGLLVIVAGVTGMLVDFQIGRVILMDLVSE